MDTRVCACKALACLKVRLPLPVGMILAVVSHLRLCLFVCGSCGVLQAKESIDQLVYVCRTDKEEVCEAAKQTLLVLGEAVFTPPPI